ncbi:hypothetical protein M1614_02605 [Candidatus Marsarchaeota archaeon]|nr:hypothetical protein [Candidatus Marsarchaeota archaeon]
MTMTCERCKTEIYKYLTCNYCSRKICNNCLKSSQKSSKTVKMVICKDCWSDMKKRNAYKNKKMPVESNQIVQ